MVPEKRRKSGEDNESSVHAALGDSADPSEGLGEEVTMASENDAMPSEEPQYPRADSDDVMRSVSPTNQSQRSHMQSQASSDIDVSDSDNEPTAEELNREAKTMYNRHALMPPRRRRNQKRHSRANSQQMNDDETPSTTTSGSSALKSADRSQSAVMNISVPTHSPRLGRSITSPVKSPRATVNGTGESASMSSPVRGVGANGSTGGDGVPPPVNRSQSENMHEFQMTDSEFDVYVLPTQLAPCRINFILFVVFLSPVLLNLFDAMYRKGLNFNMYVCCGLYPVTTHVISQPARAHLASVLVSFCVSCISFLRLLAAKLGIASVAPLVSVLVALS